MRTRRLAAVIMALGLLAACSSTPPAEQPATTSEATSEAPSAHGSFAECLREFGVPAAPGPAVGPPAGVPKETWNDAMRACGSLAPGPTA